jgi:hypothetical protein
MKTFFAQLLRCLPVAFAMALCASAHGQSAATNVVVIPQSAFADDPQRGKDPFFPDSVRRMQQVAKNPSAPRRTVSMDTTALFLKGISRSTIQPMALINNSTVAAGELADIRAGVQSIKILCREIRDRSVLVEIVTTGEVRELKLRDTF